MLATCVLKRQRWWIICLSTAILPSRFGSATTSFFGVEKVMTPSTDALINSWCLNFSSPKHHLIWKFSLMAMLWAIWKEHNNRAFSNKSSSYNRVSSIAMNLVIFWATSNEIFCGVSTTYFHHNWASFLLPSHSLVDVFHWIPPTPNRVIECWQKL